jgi:hypothetical protein
MRSGQETAKNKEKIENVGAPTFSTGVYPPVFAYVGEGKELRAQRVYVGETIDLWRKWKIENGK